MTLIQLWLMLMLAFASGEQCNIGTPITDWPDYWDTHPPTQVWTLMFHRGDAIQRFDVFEDADGEQAVFFYNPFDMPHGICAVVLPDEWRYIEGEVKLIPVTQEAA